MLKRLEQSQYQEIKFFLWEWSESFYFVFSPVHGLDGLWIQPEGQADLLFRVNRNTHDIDPITIYFDLDTYSNESELNDYTVNYILNILE